MSAIGGNALNKILGLILLVVCLPIFAGLGMLSAEQGSLKTPVFVLYPFSVMNKNFHPDFNHFMPSLCRTASAGIVSMGDIIIQFMPLFGIGADPKVQSLKYSSNSKMNMKNCTSGTMNMGCYLGA